MPPLSDRTIERLAYYVATGDAEGAREYLGHIIPRGGDMTALRTKLVERFTPAFMRLAVESLPWLDAPTFAAPLSISDRITKALDAAGASGLTRTELSAAIKARLEGASEMLVADGTIVREVTSSGGRPTERFYLARHATGRQSQADIWHDVVRPSARES